MLFRSILKVRDSIKAELDAVERFIEVYKRRSNGSFLAVVTPRAVEPVESSTSTTTTSSVTAAPTTTTPPASTHNKYGAVTALVKGAIKVAKDKYTIRDLVEILAHNGHDFRPVQVATVLNRLADKEVFVHRRGKGNKPTVYKKAAEKEEIAGS